jgi:hypothetical protein
MKYAIENNIFQIFNFRKTVQNDFQFIVLQIDLLQEGEYESQQGYSIYFAIPYSFLSQNLKTGFLFIVVERVVVLTQYLQNWQHD